MCGIFGSCSARHGGLPDPRVVEASLRTLRHRGPDDEGYVFVVSRTGEAAEFAGDDTPADVRLAHVSAAAPAGADVVLASRRLAIQDLSSAGHQPMASADGSLWIAYNGEIYNFHALRAELDQLGHEFRSGCDTEVLLHAYEEWGLDCLPRLNGMWAFALWDGRRHTLVLSRDRYGVKPLYYAWDGARLAFASELKALLAYPGISTEPDPDVLHDYIALGLVDQSDRTFFSRIAALPPGHTLELECPGGSPVVRRWYSLNDRPEPQGPYPERFAELFEDAVGLRLISDVPAGTCLSGGLDSSAIVCVVDRLLARGGHAGSADRQLTFSARYDDSRHDEGQWIDAVVAATSVEQHNARPTADALQRDLEQLVAQQDEPFWSTSIYAQWLVFAAARNNGVVVTLDGQGGDEVAGGYTHYFGPALAGLLRRGRIDRAVREASALRSLPGVTSRSLAVRTAAALSPWPVRSRLAGATRRPSWLRGPATRRVDAPDWAAAPHDPFQAQIFRDITIGLRPLLRVADRNSMAHSIESRLPFLDYRLLEFGYRAPAEAKIHGGVTKAMLREGLRDVLPAKVRERRDKLGFSTPEDDWFRGALRPVVEDVIRSQSFRDRPWFVGDEIDRTFRAHLAGENRSLEIWRWLNTELWLRRFVD